MTRITLRTVVVGEGILVFVVCVAHIQTKLRETLPFAWVHYESRM